MTESPKMPELLPCPVCQQWQKRFAGLLCDYGVGLYPARTPPPAPSTPASVGDADKILEIISIMSMAAQQSIDRPEYQYRPEAVLAGLGKIRELVSRHIQGKEG